PGGWLTEVPGRIPGRPSVRPPDPGVREPSGDVPGSGRCLRGVTRQSAGGALPRGSAAPEPLQDARLRVSAGRRTNGPTEGPRIRGVSLARRPALGSGPSG